MAASPGSVPTNWLPRLSALSDASAEKRERRRRLLHGRRKGPKLSARQQSLYETLLPRLALAPAHGKDPASYFDRRVETFWLEIGFGSGEHLLWQTQHHPEIGIIGAEPYQAGIAKLLSRIASLSPSCGAERREEPNIRIYEGDARDVIEALPDASLGRVFLLFPDPWPKRRHHKRRFIQRETLDALARVMKSQAEFRFASDDPGYIEWTLERLLEHRAFLWSAERAGDWQRRPVDWPPTRYEEKAMHGAPVFLSFHRRALQTGAAERT